KVSLAPTPSASSNAERELGDGNGSRGSCRRALLLALASHVAHEIGRRAATASPGRLRGGLFAAARGLAAASRRGSGRLLAAARVTSAASGLLRASVGFLGTAR